MAQKGKVCMQLYALDESKKVLSARRAVKQRDYFCLECGNPVRVRGGLHRQTHFFHTYSSISCTQHAKGMRHIQTQIHLQRLFPEGEVSLEKRFPTIQRIADAVWESRKIVFEIQCSPITAQEVRERNHHYGKLGYQVIWILHDSRYNKSRLSGAELLLRTHPHYYTNIDTQGKGIIYDQFDVFIQGQRKGRLDKLPVDLTRPLPINPQSPLPSLSHRIQGWPLYCQGDLLDRCLRDRAYFEQVRQTEIQWMIPQKSLTFNDLWRQYVLRPYIILFRMLLERASK